jgi:hypothetical protein
MLTRPLLVAAALAGLLNSPSLVATATGKSMAAAKPRAVGKSTTAAKPSGNACLSTDLTVASSAGTPPAPNAVTATVVAMAPVGQHVSRLHLDLEVQERTATGWVTFVTDQHSETYANYQGDHLHRMWVLHEDSQPIFALLDAGTQMRVYAGFHGTCGGGAVLGAPMVFALSVPTTLAVSPT